MVSLRPEEKEIVKKYKDYLKKNNIEGFYSNLFDAANNFEINVAAIAHITAWLREQGIEPIDYCKTKIPPYTYYYQQDLTDIVIPQNIIKLCNSSFESCRNLKSIVFPDSLKEIDICVFQRCTSLTKIIIPDNVVSIGNYAFYECTNLESVELPASIIDVGNLTFNQCPNLKEIICHFNPDEIAWQGWRKYRGKIKVVE